MSKKYVIQWRSKLNGRAGRGTRQFAEEEAQRLVAELNRDYPDIEHEMMDASAVPQNPQAQTNPTPAGEPQVELKEAA